MSQPEPVDLDLLRRLSETPGVPGREEAVRDLVRAEIEGLVDELRVDPLGNLVALRRGTSGGGERVMLSAHLDEIGFMVKFVDDRGLVRLQNLGFFDPRALFARAVTVWTKDGPLPGLLATGGRPVHIASHEESRRVPELKELYVDLGLPAADVRARVRLGDSVTLEAHFREVGHLVSGKALDNRAVVYAQIRILRALKDAPPRHDVYAVFSVQEEVMLRGAIAAAYSVEPTLGLALDTTLAVDTPGVGPDESVTTLGGGVGIKLFDGSLIADRGLVDELTALAVARGIPHQFEVLPLGGTDAGPIQRSRGGVRTAALSVPTRHIHTVVEAIHPADVRAMEDLVVAYLTA